MTAIPNTSPDAPTLRDRLWGAAYALTTLDLDRSPYCDPEIHLGILPPARLAELAEALEEPIESHSMEDGARMYESVRGYVAVGAGIMRRVRVCALGQIRDMSEAERLVYVPKLPAPILSVALPEYCMHDVAVALRCQACDRAAGLTGEPATVG